MVYLVYQLYLLRALWLNGNMGALYKRGIVHMVISSSDSYWNINILEQGRHA